MTKNNFNTAPDGTSVVNVSEILNEPTTLVLDPATTPYIDSIIQLNPTKTTFVLKPGLYKLSTNLAIRKNGIRIVGMTGVAKDVRIIQTLDRDGIAIIANSVLLQDIYLICTFSKKVCITGASMNNTVISGCYFHGAPDMFTAFFAGPSDLTEGAPTLNAYNKFYLDTGNRIYNNVFYSNFSGDSVSFSLQYKSSFVNNFIRGGKLAPYMCRTCNIFNNTITDSPSCGMFISFPSDRLSIVGNKIFSSKNSGIVMKDQLEHGTFQRYDYNIVIRNNTIFGSGGYGVEMNYAINVSITNNNIVSNKMIGIYTYKGSKLLFNKNRISYFRTGFVLSSNSDTVIEDNVIMSVFPSLGDNAVKITTASTTSKVSNNTLCGGYNYDLISNGGTNNVIGNNPVSTYYTIDDERAIYNIY